MAFIIKYVVFMLASSRIGDERIFRLCERTRPAFGV